jgi:hypothetical protein
MRTQWCERPAVKKGNWETRTVSQIALRFDALQLEDSFFWSSINGEH